MKVEIEQYVDREYRMTLSAENQAEFHQLHEILKAATNRGMQVNLCRNEGIEFVIPAVSA
jgi:hypothetical protein